VVLVVLLLLLALVMPPLVVLLRLPLKRSPRRRRSPTRTWVSVCSTKRLVRGKCCTNQQIVEEYSGSDAAVFTMSRGSSTVSENLVYLQAIIMQL
jgi:hypothetical protein